MTPSMRSETPLDDDGAAGGLAEEAAQHANQMPSTASPRTARRRCRAPISDLARRPGRRAPDSRVRAVAVAGDPQATARAIRPPSSGKAGIRLKTKQDAR